jgi:hypothetical protein
MLPSIVSEGAECGRGRLQEFKSLSWMKKVLQQPTDQLPVRVFLHYLLLGSVHHSRKTKT